MKTIVPEGYKKTKVGVIPNDWQLYRTDNVLKRVRNSVNIIADEEYKQIGIRSHGKGIFYKETVSGKELGNKSVFWIEPNCFVANIVFAWEQAIGKTTKNEIGMIASHRFPMYKPQANKLDLDYLVYLFKSKRGKYLLELASPGGAGRNKTLGQGEFAELEIALPPFKEQQKIANILTTYDEAIIKQEELIKEKEQLKKGLMQKLLNGKIRFDGFDEDWKFVKLGDLLDYLQPTQYLVSDTNYSDEYQTPVLTAGKTFILGYTNETDGIFEDNLPVIIFDDFTTATQFVDFPFKAKSSAMKILKPKDKSVNVKLVYEIMQMINFVADDHKRYWISEYQELEIKLPSKNEQLKISKFLNTINNEISLLKNELEELNLQKKALMQKLLTGQVRVKI
ncbi:restriction endonuclease subunit S [Aliarcobacter butzleri]|uniref:restriction endonuclease subunit S n=1 Tax=Aliarcobacter butzleri TaxID=28197 RepID=UPI000678CEFB|nr:restriction endonuclease subunit S [Aliarcobacter butzleri]